MTKSSSPGRVITVTLEDQGRSPRLPSDQCEYVMPLRVGSGPYQASWRHGPPRRMARDRDLELEAECEIGRPDPTRCPDPAVGWVSKKAFCRVHLKIERAKAERLAEKRRNATPRRQEPR